MRGTGLLGGLAMLAAIIGAVAFAYASRTPPPSHPVLAKASLPPVIPVQDFYGDKRAEWNYQPSFDGSMLAWSAVKWTREVVRVKRTGDADPFLTLSGEEFSDFSWHPVKNALLVTVAGRVWEVDPARPDRGSWVDVTPRGFQSVYFVVPPRSADDLVVVSSNDRNPAFHDLYTVRQDGGGKRLLEKNEGKTTGWVIDHSGLPVIRADRLDGGGMLVLIRDAAGESWRVLTEVAARDDFAILAPPAVDGTIYALSNRARDRLALVTVDSLTGRETIVAEDEKADLGGVVYLGSRREVPDYVAVRAGYPAFKALSQRGEEFLKLVLDGANPVDFDIIATSPDGRFVTVARSLRERSYEYFLYDLVKASATKLADYSFRRHQDKLAETRPVSFKARDGMEIPALLTLPRGAEPTGLPTIVQIHGGPAHQVIWQYDHEVQFLANRGYAVLSVNYRGSTGYGKAFRAAGYGEVGRKMQDDIVDAAHWLVAEGIADKANMAVMGGSYGGYSAALAMTRDPGLFKAAIVEYAVTDIAYDMQNIPSAWGLSPDESIRYWGDPDKAADLEEMRRRSPLTHAGNVQGAILLTAGKEDPVVGFEQTEEFERKLKAAGKDVTAVYFEKEGHGYHRWQTNIRRARLVEDFLARTIGGRSGGFDYVDFAGRYLD